jgi:hypothetical protein
MPATITSKENFSSEVTEKELKEEVRLRIKAGAIRSWYEKNGIQGWILQTEWNVLGEND